jgi:hypothetical protein
LRDTKLAAQSAPLLVGILLFSASHGLEARFKMHSSENLVAERQAKFRRGTISRAEVEEELKSRHVKRVFRAKRSTNNAGDYTGPDFTSQFLSESGPFNAEHSNAAGRIREHDGFIS